MAALQTDNKTNKILQIIHPDILPLANTRRSGDYRPFLKEGIPAVSLEMSGSVIASEVYHTRDDGIAVINKKALGLTADVLYRTIQYLERSSLSS